MTTFCNEGGKTHMWCYPDCDPEKRLFRICMYCKVSQTKVWKNDYSDEEAQDDTGFEPIGRRFDKRSEK